MTTSRLDLCSADAGAWLWAHLREAFPEAIAAVLMPDHPHLLLATSDPEAARQRLARLLGQLGRAFGVEGRISRVPEPAAIRGGQALARHVRYVGLNPCRGRLAECPLEWLWSTHRDVIGASVDPWVTAERLATTLELSSWNFAARHHRYVSGDPDARVDGTPFPAVAPSTNLPSAPLRTIAEAAAAAMRQPVLAIRTRGPTRALFIALARDQGWDRTKKLAEVCDCSCRTITEALRNVDVLALHAAKLCLGDPRLRKLPAVSCTSKLADREKKRA